MLCMKEQKTLEEYAVHDFNVAKLEIFSLKLINKTRGFSKCLKIYIENLIYF